MWDPLESLSLPPCSPSLPLLHTGATRSLYGCPIESGADGALMQDPLTRSWAPSTTLAPPGPHRGGWWWWWWACLEGSPAPCNPPRPNLPVLAGRVDAPLVRLAGPGGGRPGLSPPCPSTGLWPEQLAWDHKDRCLPVSLRRDPRQERRRPPSACPAAPWRRGRAGPSGSGSETLGKAAWERHLSRAASPGLWGAGSAPGAKTGLATEEGGRDRVPAHRLYTPRAGLVQVAPKGRSDPVLGLEQVGSGAWAARPAAPFPPAPLSVGTSLPGTWGSLGRWGLQKQGRVATSSGSKPPACPALGGALTWGNEWLTPQLPVSKKKQSQKRLWRLVEAALGQGLGWAGLGWGAAASRGLRPVGPGRCSRPLALGAICLPRTTAFPGGKAAASSDPPSAGRPAGPGSHGGLAASPAARPRPAPPGLRLAAARVPRA